MRYLKAVAIGLACSAVIVAAYLALREPPAEQEAAAPPVAVATPVGTAAPVATAPPAPEPARPSSVRAAIAHEFHGLSLPRALIDRLVAGDVAGVARELAGAPDAGAAVELFDLEGLCAAQAEALPAEIAAADARAAVDATGATPASRATLQALVAERRAWHERFRSGCAEARFDPAATAARLQAAALRGDGASLERLARSDPQPLVRMQGAALLGNPRAAFRIALAEMPRQPREGRSWLEVAAKADPEAAAYLGMCLLSGCAGEPDPAAARQALEAAARAGSLYALGFLATADAPDGARRWVRADEIVAPVAPRELESLGFSAAGAYPWAALAASLAARGCFGFEFTITAEALEARTRFQTALRPAELASARAQADELAATTLEATRRALGCD